MKKIIFASLIFYCASFTDVHANFNNNESFAIAIVNGEDQTAVRPEELPKAVRATLSTDHYKEWTVASAFLVKGEKEYYKIELLKGSEKKTITLNKEGHEINNTKEGKTAEVKDPKNVREEKKEPNEVKE